MTGQAEQDAHDLTDLADLTDPAQDEDEDDLVEEERDTPPAAEPAADAQDPDVQPSLARQIIGAVNLLVLITAVLFVPPIRHALTTALGMVLAAAAGIVLPAWILMGAFRRRSHHH